MGAVIFGEAAKLREGVEFPEFAGSFVIEPLVPQGGASFLDRRPSLPAGFVVVGCIRQQLADVVTPQQVRQVLEHRAAILA